MKRVETSSLPLRWELMRTRSRHELRVDTAFSSPDCPCPDIDAADVRPSTRLGRYTVLYKLGEGGTGRVFVAWDSLLRRKVALKLLRKSGRQVKERFVQEVQVLAALSHPNIVTLHDFCEIEGNCFAVMELVSGRTLRTLVTGDPIPPRHCLEIGHQIAEGLAVAHSSGIVHRDVKPENIVISDERRVKLLDFGLSKWSRESLGTAARLPLGDTNYASLVGTVPYMSPEQACGNELGFRSDIFAFGTVFFEMLTGVHPFRADTLAETLDAIVGEHPAPVSLHPSALARKLQRVAMRCLRKAPEHRHSAEELVHVLATLANPLGPE